MTISGTASYMAPEQLRGEAVDQRVDIWALGVTAAEMLSGHHPFRRDTLPAITHSICNDPPEIAGELPVSLQRIVYKCVSKSAGLRYASCDELLHDLPALDLRDFSEKATGAESSGGAGARSSGSAHRLRIKVIA